MPLPTGTITFLFTDIGGSTPMWEKLPRQMSEALSVHDAILRAEIEAQGGHVFKSLGDGVCAAFADPIQAIQAAVAGQKRLCAQHWGEVGEIQVRMGIHTGPAELRDEDYFGQSLSRVARIMAIAHPGQILVSHATAELVAASMLDAPELHELGQVQLKGLSRPEQVHQVLNPDLRRDFPPLKFAEAPNNLPARVSSFVGREAEVRELRTALRRSRLVSVTGSGGSGKTSLAIEVASEFVGGAPDGVWFVELAPISDPALVASTVAEALSISAEPGKSIVQTLAKELRPRKMLMLVDNCEHLLDECASIAQQLLSAAPSLRILATSREALGISGEVAFRVPSMGFPGSGADINLADLERFDATRLFVERAAEAAPNLQLDEKAVEFVVQICRRLDGIPLAIELAAARLRSMSVGDLAARLDDRFRILTGGSRAAVSRQRTLAATIDWSYELLSEQESSLLRHFSVFAGGWSLEAAEAVGFDEHVELWEVMDLLSHLVDKSLVVCEQTSDGTGRYRMLETIRQYSQDKLVASGEFESVRDRHVRFFLKKTKGLERHEFRAFMSQDWDNVRAAIEWSIANRDLRCVEILASCGDLEQLNHQDCIDLILRSVSAAESSAALDQLAHLCLVAANLCIRQLRVDQALEFGAQARRFSLQIGDEVKALSAERTMARVEGMTGNFESAMRRFEFIVREAGRLGNDELKALGHYGLMLVHRDLGNLDAMERYLDSAEEFLIKANIVSYSKWILAYRGSYFEVKGDIASAAQWYEAALREFIVWGSTNIAVLWIWGWTARLCFLSGRDEEAARLFGAAATHHELIRWPLQSNEEAKNELVRSALSQRMGTPYQLHSDVGASLTAEQASELAFAVLQAMQNP